MITAPHTHPTINPQQFGFAATTIESEFGNLRRYRLDQPFGQGQSEREDQIQRKDQPEGESQNQEQGQDQGQDQAQDGSSANQRGDEQERPTE